MIAVLPIAAALLVVAVLYASVGHGGASGYLAVLALAGLSPETIRPTALVLNVCVSSIALVRFACRGHLRWSVLWPFAVTAVPCAFLAGWLWSLDGGHYGVVLAAVLLFAAWRLAVGGSVEAERVRRIPLRGALPAGAVIGVVSGLIGVGGGIFLSPLLILCGWATAKQTAAASAAFVLLSSLAGLAGLWVQFGRIEVELSKLSVFVVSVVLGGIAGATLGVSRFEPVVLRRVLAVVLVVAALKSVLQVW